MRACLVIAMALAACSVDPPVLASGDYLVHLDLLDATCPTLPIPIEAGFSCPIGSFHGSPPSEQASTVDELGCSDDPLDHAQTWSVEATTQARSILGLIDTGRAFSVYTMSTQAVDLVGESDGDAPDVVVDGTSVDSLDQDASWRAQLDVGAIDRFDGTLELEMTTIEGARCITRYEVTGAQPPTR